MQEKCWGSREVIVNQVADMENRESVSSDDIGHLRLLYFAGLPCCVNVRCNLTPDFCNLVWSRRNLPFDVLQYAFILIRCSQQQKSKMFTKRL